MTNAELDAASRARAAHFAEQRRQADEAEDPNASARILATAITALAATIGAPAPVALALAPVAPTPARRELTGSERIAALVESGERRKRAAVAARAAAREASDRAWAASAVEAQRARRIEEQRAAEALARTARAEADRKAARIQAFEDERSALRDRVLGSTRAEILERPAQEALLRGRMAAAALFAAAADRVPSDPELEAKRKRQMRAGLRLGF